MSTAPLSVDAARSALLTDLYELTMLQSYHDHGMNATAVFELFVRALPPRRNFLVAAGLEPVVRFLEQLRFEPAELDWLAASGRFRAPFLASLRDLRFTGDLYAVPEGTPVFADEPLLRVEAPMREAQLVETRLVNLVQLCTLVASKAARCRLAAPGKLLVDFGLRRAHGAEAGVLAARAAYLAGFDGTSNVLAGAQYGMPLYGTMAHSYVQAHRTEALAFEHFARSFPAANTLLIDTYDTEAAAAGLAALARRLAAEGIALHAVRIDSGDLGEHARRVRRILDDSGLRATTIFASGSLDDDRLQALERAHAPIDGYGVGTQLVTSGDHPYLDCAYKLQAYEGRATRKRSEGKATWPGPKQVWRRSDANGVFLEDHVRLAHETEPPLAGAPGAARAEPLLRPVLRAGGRVGTLPDAPAIRAHALEQLARLPAALRALDDAEPPYPVRISEAIVALRDEIDRLHAGGA